MTVQFARAAVIALALSTTSSAWADASTSSAAYAKALALFQAGNVRGARVELLNAIKENPDNAAARLLNARVLLLRGDGVNAQTEIERAIKAGAPREFTYHLTANALFLQREFSKALDVAKPTRIPPQFQSYAARMRGRAQAALGADSEAAAEFERAARLAPSSPEALTDLARYQAGKRDAKAAVASVDRALAIAPGNVQALMLKGNLTRALVGLPQALPYFDKAIATDGNNIEALLERAATLGDMKREDAARADIAKVKGLAPNHPLALYLEAVLAARGGKMQEAQTLLSNTKGTLDRYPPAQMLQGMVAFQLGNTQQAAEAFKRVVAAAPNNPVALKLLAVTQLRLNDAPGALATLKPFVAVPNLDAGTLSLLGSAYARSGDFKTAQTYLERASTAAPGQKMLGTQLAMTKLAQGDLSGAEGQLQQVLRSDPNSLQALVTLAAVKLRERDYRGAGAAAQRIVESNPQLPIGYNLRGTAAIGLRNPKLAEINFRQALQRKADYVEARRNLAQILLATGRLDQGRAEVATLLQQKPNDLRAMLLMAELSGRANKPAERIDWLKRATTANPQAIEPKAALVQSYVAAGNFNQALTDASALARSNGDDPRVLQLLGGTQVAAKQLPAAIQTFERLVAQRPTDLGARIMLARVQTVANNIPAARATYQAALKLPGAAPEPVYQDLIGLDVRAKNFDGALANAEALKKATTQKVAADKLIGDINLAANRPRDALAAYTRVRAKNDSAPVATAIASAQARMGQPQAALATLEGYRKSKPKDPLGWAALADFHLQTRNYKAAITTYEAMRAGGMAANDPGILNNLAWAYHRTGDRRALATAAAAYQGAPRAPAVQDTYGVILIDTRADVKKGLALLQQASKAVPVDPNIRFHLGAAYRANGMAADARRELAAALKSPALENPAGARQMLASLGR